MTGLAKWDKRLLFTYESWEIYDYPVNAAATGTGAFAPIPGNTMLSDIWHNCENPTNDPSPCYQSITKAYGWKCFACGELAPEDIVGLWILQNFDAIGSRDGTWR